MIRQILFQFLKKVKNVTLCRGLFRLKVRLLKIFVVVLSIFLIIYYFSLKVPRHEINNSYFCTVLNFGCITVKIREPGCSCKRKVFTSGAKWETEPKYNSTCSDESSRYSKGQKVISFTIHGKYDIKSDTERILWNLKRMRKFYPGYVMRLYTQVRLQMKYCHLICDNEDIHWCDIRKTPSHGDLSKMYHMTWRFIPLGDETVDIFHSRDLDSLISAREVDAVSDWLQNVPNKSIMVMRDHHNYHQKNLPVHGGLWGARNTGLGEKKALSLQSALMLMSSHQIQGVTEEEGLDQIILYKTIFNPLYMKNVIAYDSYHCDKWKGLAKTAIKPFPTKRLGKIDYVGRKDFDKEERLESCPDNCRPVHGRHWTYC